MNILKVFELPEGLCVRVRMEKIMPHPYMARRGCDRDIFFDAIICTNRKGIVDIKSMADRFSISKDSIVYYSFDYSLRYTRSLLPLYLDHSRVDTKYKFHLVDFTDVVRPAVYAFLNCMKKLCVPKDLRKLIAEFVLESKYDAGVWASSVFND